MSASDATSHDGMACDRAALTAANEAYEALHIFEDLEMAGKIRGNGHHMRQRIAEAAASLVRERWIGEQ